ncbi:EAL domain-containing protein [Terasakiella pusilla]|uniref:EAL domain-containing protein n=1 Tax=Terasakiella pusilla TaxID=64973 RepID=UPI003AA86BDA
MNELEALTKSGKINLLNQLTIDAFPFPVFIKDWKRHYVLCNAAFYDFLKARPNQIIGLTAREISPAKNAETYKDADDNLFQNGGSQTYRAHVQDFDGLSHYVEFRKALVVSSEGKQFLVGSIIDLTELEESFERCHLLSDLASEAILMHRDGLIQDCNKAAETVFCLPNRKIIGSHISNYVDDRWLNYVTYLCINHKEEQCELQMVRSNGEHFPVLATFKNGVFKSRNVGVVSIRDRSGDLAQTHLVRKLWTAIEQSHNTILMTDPRGNIEYVNPHFSKVTGYSKSEVIGQNPKILKSGRTPAKTYKEMWKTLRQQKTWQGELVNKRKDGSLYWEKATIAPVVDRYNQTTGFIAVKDDVSIIKQQEEQLLHQAYYDGLTDLPNRVLAYDRLEQGLRSYRRGKKPVGVIFIDLDDFKKVNDTLGHQVGDAVLIEAGKRLTTCVRETDTVGRQGGDEFLIILPDLEDTDVLAQIAEKIIDAFKVPFFHVGMDIHIGTSIGIAVSPTDGEDASTLMRNADLAMYKSKEAGKNIYTYFQHQLSENALRKIEIERQLRKFKTTRELYPVFQPIVDAVTQDIVGAEVLLRWENKKLGQVSPAEFIPVIEQSGLIVEIGKWVLDAACTALKTWADKQLIAKDFFLSVNVSPRQFRELNLPEAVLSVLKNTGAKAENLKLEVTETLLLSDADEVKRQLQELKSLGVKLSLDDFGTGYSSLVALKRFPFTTVKIDKTFVDDIEVDEEERLLCAAAIAMGRSLKLDTIIEGVETQKQLDFVKEHGADYIQGYLTGRPMRKNDFENHMLKTK